MAFNSIKNLRRSRFNVILLGIAILLFLFSATPHSAEKFRFVVMSDSHNTLSRIKPAQVAAAIMDRHPQFILHAGDFTCCLGDSPHNRFKFDELQFLGGIPFFPTTGNHDYDGTAIADYDAFWKTHGPEVPISGEWAHTYSFDINGYHFVALNFRKPDFSWLKSDLNKNAGKPTVIFSHLCALNIGCKPAFNQQLHDIALSNRDIRAVFSGHSHCCGNQEIKPGTLQVFVGTVSHDNSRDPKFKGKHTFVVVDVDGRNLKITPATVE